MKPNGERRASIHKRSKNEGVPRKRSNSNTNSLIFDNGGYTIKIGYTKSDSVTSLPNHIMKAKSERKRCFIADQIEDCRDLSGLFYIMPNDHGYIAKYDVQKTVWDYVFNKFPLDDSSVIMTQPLFNFRHIQEYVDEIFFEEYDVKSLYRANPTDLSRYQYVHTVAGEDSSCVIVDSGYSFTHIVPYINGKKYTNGIIRLDIGGKLLTNYLKDILSYRQLHVMEETYVINQVKEDTCFTSLDFKSDMKRARTTNDIVKNYVLPDFHNIRRGYVQDSSGNNELAENCQILRLNNERFSVPEVLLRPTIIPGMEHSGLAQCIAACIKKCPVEFRKELASNVVLTGGNCCFPGFTERLQKDVTMYLPSNYNFKVHLAEDPINYAWMGGQLFSQDSKFRSSCVTKEQYEEYGPSYTYKKFNDFTEIEEEAPKEDESDTFSYLSHWKNQGVDIFQKDGKPINLNQDIQFMLEGENIDEFDGKYVDIEFEYEKKAEDIKPKTPEPIKRTAELTATESSDPTKIIKKRRTVLHIEPTKPNTILKTSTPETPKPIILQSNVASSSTSPTIIRQPLKVYRPMYKPHVDVKVNEPRKFITVAGNTLTLNGNSYIVPSTINGKTIINTRHLLNNTVILPPNLLTKNVTLQLIPIRPEHLRQNNVTTIITKKP